MFDFLRIIFPLSGDTGLIERSLHCYIIAFIIIAVAMLAIIFFILFPFKKISGKADYSEEKMTSDKTTSKKTE